MPLRAAALPTAALPTAALSTTFLLTSVIDQRRSIISEPRKISSAPDYPRPNPAKHLSGPI